MSQVPTASTGTYMQSDRGGLILTFGILSLFICMIFGVVAWVMANNDLRAMDAGRMDPAGRGLTQAGKACGMVSVILALLGCVGGLVLLLLWLLLGVGLFAVGAAAG